MFIDRKRRFTVQQIWTTKHESHWLITMYVKTSWWKKEVASAQWTAHNKKTAVVKVMAMFGKLKLEIL